MSSDKALLQFSFRYLTDDHFWFTFFHEAGHLILEGDNAFFLDGGDTPRSDQEHRANEFAADLLVPPEERNSLLTIAPNARDVIRFAVRIGVSPGIVVGQLQHAGRIRQNQLNHLKRRFMWEPT
jgi:Zn-dependent peptidase ImmA (M78 family)